MRAHCRLREVKLAQRRLTESAAGLVDVGRMQSTMAEKLDLMRDEQRLLAVRLEALEEHLSAAADALLRVPALIGLHAHDALAASREPSHRSSSPALEAAALAPTRRVFRSTHSDDKPQPHETAAAAAD